MPSTQVRQCPDGVTIDVTVLCRVYDLNRVFNSSLLYYAIPAGHRISRNVPDGPHCLLDGSDVLGLEKPDKNWDDSLVHDGLALLVGA